MTHYELNARINELNAQAAMLLSKIKDRMGERREVQKKRVPDGKTAQMNEVGVAVSGVLDDLKQSCPCRHSVVFDQLAGEFVFVDKSDLKPAEVFSDTVLLPLCKVAELLSKTRSRTGKRPCPFYRDIDPQNGVTKFQIGDFSSHRCDYFDYMAADGPLPRVVNHLRAWIPADQTSQADIVASEDLKRA
jgi:hypothetical protein